ncbi:hypothetical protein AVEN_254291-1 [Araneus ventricosus]|uniref:Uncharacterized protein n=1 Tax=Araneus ventricosus TaxID=182803 RepID=A0A4Y2FAN3_ARAVE|nr:hypothetical protein AVEN_254291-1 [Araneus ventricosus]
MRDSIYIPEDYEQDSIRCSSHSARQRHFSFPSITAGAWAKMDWHLKLTEMLKQARGGRFMSVMAGWGEKPAIQEVPAGQRSDIHEA